MPVHHEHFPSRSIRGTSQISTYSETGLLSEWGRHTKEKKNVSSFHACEFQQFERQSNHWLTHNINIIWKVVYSSWQSTALGSLQFCKSEFWTETGIKGWEYETDCSFVLLLVQLEIQTLLIHRLVKYFLHPSIWHIYSFLLWLKQSGALP